MTQTIKTLGEAVMTQCQVAFAFCAAYQFSSSKNGSDMLAPR